MHVIWYHVKLLKVCLCRIFEHVLLLILNGNSLYICYKLPSKHGKVIFLHKTYALDLFNFYLGGRAKVNICGNSTLFLFDFVGIQMNKFSQICLRTPPQGKHNYPFVHSLHIYLLAVEPIENWYVMKIVIFPQYICFIQYLASYKSLYPIVTDAYCFP